MEPEIQLQDASAAIEFKMTVGPDIPALFYYLFGVDEVKARRWPEAYPEKAESERESFPAKPTRDVKAEHEGYSGRPDIVITPQLDKSKEISAETTATASVLYSTNWAGAILKSPPAGQRFRSAHGTFKIPTITKGSGSHEKWAVAAWVGIDGFTSSNAILRTGVSVSVDAEGKQSCAVWYEWYPSAAYTIRGFHPSPGDVISISISMRSPSESQINIKNTTTGKKVLRNLTALSPDSRLIGENAEWIVEDFAAATVGIPSSSVAVAPVADFGSVMFTKARAGIGRMRFVGLKEAVVMKMVDGEGKKVLADVDILGKRDVVIEHRGS